MKKGFLFILVAVASIAFLSLTSATVLSTCADITSPGYYEITSDFVPDNSNNLAYCFVITSAGDDVIFNGNGYTFNNASFNDPLFLVNNGRDNVTITNFTINTSRSSSAHGVQTGSGVTNLEISHINVVNSDKLFYPVGCTDISRCYNISIHDNNITSDYGIYLESVDGLDVYNNNFSTTSYAVFQREQPSFNFNFTNNDIYREVTYNVSVYNATFYQNRFYGEGEIQKTNLTEYDRYVVADRFNITENNFTLIGGSSLAHEVVNIPGATNLWITKNRIEDGEGFAFDLQNVTNAIIEYNYYFNQSKCLGTDMDSGHNGESANISVRHELCYGKIGYDATYDAISSHGFISHSNDTNVTNCTVQNMDFGFLTHNGSRNNFFTNNSASNVSIGIYVIDEAYNNTHENYTLYNASSYAMHFFRYNDRGASYPDDNLIKNVFVNDTASGIGFSNISTGNNTAEDIVINNATSYCATGSYNSTGGKLINVTYSSGCTESVTAGSSFNRYWYLGATSNVSSNITLYNSSSGSSLYSALSSSWVTQMLLAYINSAGTITNQTYSLNATASGYTSTSTVFNLTNNTNVSFSLSATSSSSTSTSSAYTTYYASEDAMKEGYTRVLARDRKISFVVRENLNSNETVRHSLLVNNIDTSEKTVKITVSSDPQTNTLSIGETWKINLDDDSENDIAITLNEVTSSGLANITLIELTEDSVEETTEANQTEVAGNQSDSTNEQSLEASEESSSAWKIILLILILLALAAAGFFYYKKKKSSRN